MTIRVLFFAQYRDVTGADECELVLAPGSTVADVVSRLRTRPEGWSKLPERPAVARNRVVVPLTEPLSDGDELALLPPVAGG